MLQQLHALSRAAQRPRTVSAAAWSAAAAVSAAAWSAQLARPSPLAWSPNITASCKRNASGHNHGPAAGSMRAPRVRALMILTPTTSICRSVWRAAVMTLAVQPRCLPSRDMLDAPSVLPRADPHAGRHLHRMPRIQLALSIIAVSTLALPVVQAWTIIKCNPGIPGPAFSASPECCAWSGNTDGVFMRGCAALVLHWLCLRVAGNTLEGGRRGRRERRERREQPRRPPPPGALTGFSGRV